MSVLDVKDYLGSDFPFIEANSSSYEYLSDIGFTKTRKGFIFSHNKFAAFFCKHVALVYNEGLKVLSLYNQAKGVYELDASHIISVLIRYMMNMTNDELWTPTYEQLAVEAIKREIVTFVQFNNSEYINLQDGILDLSSYELLSHSPDYYTSIQLPFKYNSNCPTPNFSKYLREVCCEDVELMALLQEVTGYCLCNSTQAEKAFFLIGSGSNGKSIYAKILQHLVGLGNYSSTSLSALNKSFGMAQLVNSNVNIASENNPERINSEVFKAVVSGDTVEVDIKYKNPLTLALHVKLILLFNELPANTDLSYGFYRRIVAIPFRRTFSGKDVDVYLLNKLEQELSGIFHWALAGLKRLRSNDYRFSKCSASEECLQAYKNQLNPIADFFEEYFVFDKNSSIKKSDLYSIYYNEYCEKSCNTMLSLNHFWKYTKAYFSDHKHNFATKKIKGYEYLVGINVKNNFKKEIIL